VIGNASYASLIKVPKAENDAYVIAGVLASAGFDVVTSNDVTHGKLEAVITDLKSRIDRAASNEVKPLVVLYFSGHGFISSNRQYIVTVELGRSDLISGSFAIDDIIDELPSGIVVVLLDACRSDFSWRTGLGKDEVQLPTEGRLNGSSANKEVIPVSGGSDSTTSKPRFGIGYANKAGRPVRGYVNEWDYNSPYSEGLRRYLGRGRTLKDEFDAAADFVEDLNIDHHPYFDICAVKFTFTLRVMFLARCGLSGSKTNKVEHWSGPLIFFANT
jgi:hypothetical protein